MSNKNCSPDIVKYFVVEPAGGGGATTGSTGNFYVCQGTTFLRTISGCTDNVNLNGNIFYNENSSYNSGDVYFNGVITACTGIHTSSIRGCSPITVHDKLIILDGLILTGSSVSEDNSLTQILARDSSSGLVKYLNFSAITIDNTLTSVLGRDPITGQLRYRTVESIISAATAQDTFVTGTTFSDNQAVLTRNDGVDVLSLTGGTNVTLSNTSTNQIKLDVNIPADTNTFVTGFTYDDINTFTIGRNDGIDLTSTISILSGVTYYGDGGGLYNIPISGVTNLQTELDSKLDVTVFKTYTADTKIILDTKISGATNLSSEGVFAQKNGFDLEFKGLTSTGGTVNISSSPNTVNLEVIIPTDQDKFVSGGTYNPSTLDINFVGNSTETIFDVDLTPLVASVSGDTDTFVTGFTFNNSTYDLTIKQNNGQSDLTSNLSVLASDVYVLSGVYNSSTGIVTYTNSSGGTFQVSGFTTGMTDSYTTDAYLSGTEIRFDNNIQGSNLYNVDLISLLSGKTDNTTFNTYTANTQTILDGKIGDGVNFGGGSEVFSGKSGTDLYFRTLSGGSNTTISTINDIIRVDVTIPIDTNTFVTGATLTGTNYTLERNDGVNISTDFNSIVSGKTDSTTFNTYTANTQTILDGKIDSANNVGGANEFFKDKSGTTLNFRTLSGGSNTTISTIGDVVKVDVTIPSGINTFVTGTTFVSNQATVARNDGVGVLFLTGGTNVTLSNPAINQIKVDVSIPAGMNSYVTGGTVSGTNLLLGRNGGLSNVTIDTSAYFDNTDNYVTGATMNVNTLELSRSGGLSNVTVDLSQFVDDTNYYVTGSTMNGNILELGRNGGLSTLTTDLSQFIDDTDNYVTGATYSSGTLTLLRQNGTVDVDVPDTYITGATLNNTNLELSRNEGLSTLTVDLSSIDTFVTGTTFGSNQSLTRRNDGADVLILTGGTNVTLSNPSTNQIKIDVNIPAGMNSYVTGGTVSGTNLLLGRNGGLPNVTIDTSAYFDNTDNYVTGATMNVNTLELSRSGGLSNVTVDLSQFVDDTNDGVVSGATMNVNTLELGRTQGLSNVTVDLSQFVDTNTYVTGTTFSSNQAILTRNDGTEILKLSGGTNVTLSNPSTNQIKIDASIPAGSNTFVTGFTYNDANTFTISDNAGDSFLASINIMTGLTVYGSVSATTFYGDGSSLTGVGGGASIRNISSTDTFASANETINCTSGTFIVNLPTAVGIQGTTYTLVNSGTGTISLKGSLGQTINDSTTIDLKRQYISRTVQSNGSNWIII